MKLIKTKIYAFELNQNELNWLSYIVRNSDTSKESDEDYKLRSNFNSLTYPNITEVIS